MMGPVEFLWEVLFAVSCGATEVTELVGELEFMVDVVLRVDVVPTDDEVTVVTSTPYYK